MSPFSAGMVKISPRASTTTRLPVGDSEMLEIRLVTSSQRGIIHGKSPRAVMSTGWLRPLFGSSAWMRPACSKTIAPAPASIVLTSKSVNFVDLRELLGLGVERPDVRDAVAIGQEVDRVARPHRIHVLRVGPRRRDEIVGLEIDDPDRPVLAAAIVAPLLVPGVVHAIRDVRAVRRNLALVAARQGQRLLDAADGGHRPESRRGVGRPARAAGGEEHRRAVGRPALDRVGAGMPRQALGIAAFGRHDIHVGVAGIFAAEGNRSAVRRKVRVRRLALKAREAARETAGSLDHPDVVGVGKRDLRRADGRRSQQPRRLPVRARHVERPTRRQRHRRGNARTSAGNTSQGIDRHERTARRFSISNPPGRDPKGKRRAAEEKPAIADCGFARRSRYRHPIAQVMPQKSLRFHGSRLAPGLPRPRQPWLARRATCAAAAGGETCGRRFGNLMSDLLRLLGGCVFLALAALTAVAAPNQFLWKLSVAATEGGHWLAIGALVSAIPWRGQGKLGKLGGIMSLGAAALFALPLFYASQMNTGAAGDARRQLRDRRSACAGASRRTLRPEPLVMFDLVSSVQSRPVRLEERVFNTTDGEKLTLDIYKPGYNHDLRCRASSSIHGGSWQSGAQQGIHRAQRLPRRARLRRRLDQLPAGAEMEVPGGPRRRPVGDRVPEGLRPRVRPRRDAAGAPRAIGRRSARAARGLHRRRAGDPRRHLGLRPDGSEVRVRPTRRQGPAGHARRARELSRRTHPRRPTRRTSRRRRSTS